MFSDAQNLLNRFIKKIHYYIIILLCYVEAVLFFARTESGIFRSVLRADPNLNDSPWPSVTPEAKDFVKRLLNKDHRKRMTASQALSKIFII